MKTFSTSLCGTVLVLCLSWAAQGQESPKKAAPDGPLKDHSPLLELVPKALIKEMEPGSKTMQEGVVKANQFMLAKTKDKPCELEGLVGSVEKRFSVGSTAITGYMVSTRSERVRASGNTFPCTYNFHFDLSEAEKVMKLKPGSRIKIEGTTLGAGFGVVGRLVLFTINVKVAKLK